MKVEFEKSYNWTQLEDQWYARWLKKDYFTGDENSSNESFSIVIPPPNITGKLTMGHVLNNTIQDVLIRKARMEGKNTCWIPGIDHASIATETKVVKMLDTTEKGSIEINSVSEVFPTFFSIYGNKIFFCLVFFYTSLIFFLKRFK